MSETPKLEHHPCRGHVDWKQFAKDLYVELFVESKHNFGRTEEIPSFEEFLSHYRK